MKSKYARWGFSHLLAILMIVAAGSAFAAGEALMHNSDNLGTKYGAWGVAGGKYGQFTCTTCHNTTTDNIMRVGGTLTPPQGNWSSSKASTVTVIFNNMTAFGDDTGGHVSSNRICEVCHSKTSVHRYDTTGQADLNHKGANGTDCTVCHSHADAFKGKGCTACHGYYPGSGNDLVTGQHTAHLTTYVCADCHAKTIDPSNNFTDPTAHQNGTFGDFSGARAGGVLVGGSCSNVYCHTNGKGGAPATPVNWATGPALDCKGCHGGGSSTAGEPSYSNGGAGATDANTHPQHVAATGGASSCQNCHGATMSGTSLNGSGKHTDTTIDVLKGNSKDFGYDSGTKTCSNISCHSNGKFAAVGAQWGDTLDCSGCHASSALTSGSHSEHLAKTAGCGNCHSSTTTTGTSIDGTTHMDNSVDLVPGGNFGSPTPKAVSFTYAGAGTCNNISCHSPYATPINTAVWGQPTTCETCHPKANLSGAHNVHMGALNLASGVYYNMTANRSPAQADTVARTHGFGCGQCHPMDTANHLNGTIDVDLNRVGVAGVSTLRFLNHSSAAYDMGGTKKCSNIYCHSNASRVEAESNVGSNTSLAWNDTFAAHPGTDRCAYCHGNQPTTGAHAAHAVGNHTDNIFTGKSGKVSVSNRANTAHGNPNNSTTIGCYICHQATVTSKANDNNLRCATCHFSGNSYGATLYGAANINNLSNHVNGSREIQFLPVKVLSKAQIRPESFKFYSGVWERTTYKNMSTLSYDRAKYALDTASMWHPDTPMESNCSNIACHNGHLVKWNLANWNDPNKCMDCHNQL